MKTSSVFRLLGRIVWVYAHVCVSALLQCTDYILHYILFYETGYVLQLSLGYKNVMAVHLLFFLHI